MILKGEVGGASQPRWSQRLEIQFFITVFVHECVCTRTHIALYVSIAWLDTKLKPSVNDNTSVMLIRAKIFMRLVCEHLGFCSQQCKQDTRCPRQGHWAQ